MDRPGGAAKHFWLAVIQKSIFQSSTLTSSPPRLDIESTTKNAPYFEHNFPASSSHLTVVPIELSLYTTNNALTWSNSSNAFSTSSILGTLPGSAMIFLTLAP